MTTKLTTASASARCTARYHGTESAYVRGCRCSSAREQLTTRRRLRRHGLAPAGLVNATGSTRKVRALAWMGWTNGSIAAHAGVGITTVELLAAGRLRTVRRHTAERITGAFEALSMRHGGSTRTANRARRLGWHPPLAWDDDQIDDPHGEPAEPQAPHPSQDVDWVRVERAVRGEPVVLNTVEQRHAIELLWRDPTVTTAEIAVRVGSNAARVQQLVYRRGWPRRDGCGGLRRR